MTVISGTRVEGWRRPTRASMALFEAKAAAFRLRRGLLELGRAPPRLKKAADAGAFVHVAAESVSELWSDLSLAERGMQVGKVQNLRRAAAALDGLELPAGQVFSFWRQVGRATRRRGYVEGRMLREGCMMASVGGGLCQLSNALYDAALAAGCEIVERHAHSQVVPGSAAVAGRDATVAWNYVDLRFVSPEPRLLRVILGARTLTARLLARAPATIVGGVAPGEGTAAPAGVAERCSDCDQTDCFLHEHGARAALAAGRAAFLVDEAWPELMDHVRGAAGAGDLLAAPDFRRWSGKGFGEAREARLASAMRSLGWRLTPPQGAARRSADARATAAIAAALGRRLTPDVLDVTVAQSLLPHLWRAGALGGRRLTVLMTRLPMAALQAQARRGVRRPSRPRHARRLPRRAVAGGGRERGAGGGGADRHPARRDRRDVRRARDAAALAGAGARLRTRPAGARRSRFRAQRWRAKAASSFARRRSGWAFRCGRWARRWRGRTSGPASRSTNRRKALRGSRACARSCIRRWSRRRRGDCSRRWPPACR